MMRAGVVIPAIHGRFDQAVFTGDDRLVLRRGPHTPRRRATASCRSLRGRGEGSPLPQWRSAPDPS
jgi:hypothetical protein